MNGLFRAAAGLLFLLLAGAAGAQGSPGKRPQLFSQPPVAMQASNAPGVRSQAAGVRLNGAEILALAPQQEVELNLPDGSTHVVVLELATAHGGGMTSWIGRIKDYGNHYRVIFTTGPGGTYGAIDTPRGSFRILPGEDHDWLVDMAAERPFLPAPKVENDALIPPTRKALPLVDLAQAHFQEAVTGVNTVAQPKDLPVGMATIDMMFVVTRGLADRLGTNLMTRLNFLVTRANTSYADSHIAMTMRMVNLTIVDYPDNTTGNAALRAISPGDPDFDAGVFGNIETIRTQFGADMVTLLRDGSSFGGSGVAWVPLPSDTTYMYSTMEGCVASCESVWIHEIGHNMGNHHDRPTAAWQNGGNNTYSGVAGFAFGYPFCKPNGGAITCNPFIANGGAGGCGGSQPECSADDPSNFADIMSYFHATTATIYKFSNAHAGVTCATPGGDLVPRPCGIAAGPANSADTATSMNNAAATISARKATVAASLPGAVQFTATGYSASEAGGTITFTVSRVNGSTGAISVNYAVAGGTATSGTDFTAAPGTLNWADGVTANQNIVVTLANDGLAEGAESMTVTLSSPGGSPGVFLGYPTTAVGLIVENFGGTAGGALPSGFTSTDWTVANDQAYDGTTSLRSANVHGNFGSPANSDLTYTGTIPAGGIAFAYRVSSYQGYGNLEFSVDGTTVLTATGETGWRLFFYTLASGGSHTLRWRFANELPFNCSVANPPAEGGASCADRAWIDSVSLPISLTSLTVTKNGTGTGTVTSAPAGISCGSTCVAQFATGTPVTLTAAAAGGSVFTGWGGGTCTGTSTCPVTLNSATTVSAAFTTAAGSPTGLANPATVGFGGNSIQTTSAPLTVTLTNIGTGTLTISNVAVSSSVFARTHDCTSLALAASCTVTLTFTPTAQGAAAGNLTFTTSAGTVTVPLTGTGELSLVKHFYRSILNRAPEPGGQEFWEAEAARLTGLGANINEVWFVMANYFFNSPEYIAASKTNTAFLIDVYYTFFNRSPDQGGFDFWMSQMNAGLSREGVTFWFMFSPEFRTFTQGIFGSAAARPEVDMVMDLFRGILNRFPDTAAFNAFVGQLRSAQCQSPGAVYTAVNDMSYFFLFGSAEYANRARTNTQFVSDMYNAFLRRGGVSTEVGFWINQLNTAAKDRNTERSDFIASPEFGARVTAVINAGCLP